MTQIKILDKTFVLPDTDEEWSLMLLSGEIENIDSVTAAMDDGNLTSEEYHDTRVRVIKEFNEWLIRNIDKYTFTDQIDSGVFACNVFKTEYHVYRHVNGDENIWDYIDNASD